MDGVHSCPALSRGCVSMALTPVQSQVQALPTSLVDDGFDAERKPAVGVQMQAALALPHVHVAAAQFLGELGQDVGHLRHRAGHPPRELLRPLLSRMRWHARSTAACMPCAWCSTRACVIDQGWQVVGTESCWNGLGYDGLQHPPRIGATV